LSSWSQSLGILASHKAEIESLYVVIIPFIHNSNHNCNWLHWQNNHTHD